ncbi:hypothetical protein Vi05172_g8429 [Venturia inaequalis]|nr:hypothetical protein Vi05172_g8429 [Venturia inaequalis]
MRVEVFPGAATWKEIEKQLAASIIAAAIEWFIDIEDASVNRNSFSVKPPWARERSVHLTGY